MREGLLCRGLFANILVVENVMRSFLRLALIVGSSVLVVCRPLYANAVNDDDVKGLERYG
jgi:hypothetical protein